jgi:hypothetical protein
MTLKMWEWISIILAAMVCGIFCGPWVALSRSMKTFGPEISRTLEVIGLSAVSPG